MERYETIIKTIHDRIDYLPRGVVNDPEYNFSSMSENTVFSDLTNLTLYNKTGKNVHIPRLSNPSQLIIYIDNNQNFEIWNKKNPPLIDVIQQELQNLIGIDIRWGSDYTNNPKTSDYFSYLEELLPQIYQEIYAGNVIVLISDFLLQLEGLQEAFEKLNSDYFIALQIMLPPFSKFYHQFYIKELKSLQIERHFEI